jgi:hypothetical protein
MDTTEELCSITAQYAVSNKAAQHHPAPTSSRDVSPDIIIRDVEEGGRRGASSTTRRLQPRPTMTAASTNKQAIPLWWVSQLS